MTKQTTTAAAPAAPAAIVLNIADQAFLREDGKAEGLADANLGKFAQLFQPVFVTATQPGDYARYAEMCRQWRAGYDGRRDGADVVLARITDAIAKVNAGDLTAKAAATFSDASQHALERRINIARSGDAKLLIGDRPKSAAKDAQRMNESRKKKADEAKVERDRLAGLVQGKTPKQIADDQASKAKAQAAANAALLKTQEALVKANESAAKASSEAAKEKARQAAQEAAAALAEKVRAAQEAEKAAADVSKAAQQMALEQAAIDQKARADEAAALRKELGEFIKKASLGQLRAIRQLFPTEVAAK